MDRNSQTHTANQFYILEETFGVSQTPCLYLITRYEKVIPTALSLKRDKNCGTAPFRQILTHEIIR